MKDKCFLVTGSSSGIGRAITVKLLDAGADVLVAGSFVFKSDNPTQTIADLKAV